MISTFKSGGLEHFLLANDNLSCILRINCGKVELVHFGRPVSEHDAKALAVKPGPGWGTSILYDDGICLDVLPLAWSESGAGDYRESPVEIQIDGKSVVPSFEYKCAGMVKTQMSSTLPSCRGQCESLCLTLVSSYAVINLYFDLYETALVRRTELLNKTNRDITVTKIMSMMMDLKGDYKMTTLDGNWIAETHAHTVDVSYSKVVNESLTGFSSNRHNPGFLLSNNDEVYGFNLVYSGNHYASAQKSHQNFTRVMQGINHDNFTCCLKKGEKFETPEAVMAYSCNGMNGIRHAMHKFVNEHIVPEYWQYRERPVLYNDWEGCMFDFDENKLLKLAKKAKAIGCELFVLDDGWFGQRNSDTAGLGDYEVNTKKLPNGLNGLSKKLKSIGLDFGLWFEPEAVNPDSDLFRTHPDWALEGGLGRNEYLLDLRRAEVRDYIVENVSRIIDESDVKYVKWDMNRHSPLLGYDAHEYILGLYDVLSRIFTPRPQVLLEGCASGGNRFDLGILCFAPQSWASDNTDPIERLDIKEGLSYLYPLSTMGCHISASAHIQTLRATPLSTRANVSFFGIFGLELDLTHLLPVEIDELKNAVSYYKEHRKLFQFGEFSTLRCEKGATSWQVSTKDKTAVGVFHRIVHAAQGYEWLYADVEKSGSYDVESRPQLLRVMQFSSMVRHLVPLNLDPNGAAVRAADRFYRMQDSVQKTSCTGAALKAGVPMNLKFTGTGYDSEMRNQGDFSSNIYLITKCGRTEKVLDLLNRGKKE